MQTTFLTGPRHHVTPVALCAAEVKGGGRVVAECDALMTQMQNGLLCAKILAYAQGFLLLGEGALAHGHFGDYLVEAAVLGR